MITVVALAVAETPGVGSEPLLCARHDAEMFYATFARLCVGSFDGAHSYVGINPSSSQCRELMLLAAGSTAPSNVLILYISSHGFLRNGSLSIPFSDARLTDFGFVESGEIASSLRRCPGQVLLVLDCCFSGAALGEAHLRDVYDAPKISVMTSAQPYGRAHYGPSGSDFTLAFIRALERISGAGEAFTVGKIADYIRRDREYTGEMLVNLAEGTADLHLAEPPDWYKGIIERRDFEVPFLDRVLASPLHTREMLWYSLEDVPDNLKLKIFNWERAQLALRDPSWLVRRAMGTILSRVDDVHPGKPATILALLSARSWMHECVGLVAARNSLDDPKLADQTKLILTGSRHMDAIWLANLYLSDHSGAHLVDALASPLGRTEWGVVDLWKRYGPRCTDEGELARIFRTALAGRPEILSALRVHLDCTGSVAGELLGTDPIPEVTGNELVRFQYQRKPRGIILAPTAVKWLASSLYGSWRDQLEGGLREYLDNTEEAQVVRDLGVCRRIPSVEHRVSICQDLAAAAVDVVAIIDAARWTVTDPHPWVRRESLRLFPRDRAAAEKALGVSTDRSLFPGCFDLFLEGHRNGADVAQWLPTMTRAERESLTWATAQEPG